MTYVRVRLVKEFWVEVKEYTKNRLNLNDWKLKEGAEIFGVSHNSWKDLFSIEYGKLTSDTWLGIWCNSDSIRFSTEEYDRFGDRLKEVDKKLAKRDKQWYPAWLYTGDNFSQWTTLDKILPSIRKIMVERYSSMLCELVEKTKSIIDETVDSIENR